MKIGVSVSIFWDYQKLDLPKAIVHSVEDLGFEAVEFHCENPLFRGWGTERSKETEEEIKEVMSNLDAGLSLHAPFHDVNLATLNSEVGEEAIRQHRYCIEMAKDLGADVVNVHPGYCSSRKFRKEDCFQLMIKNLKEICDIASDNGVKVCVENLAFNKKCLGFSIPDMKRIMREVDKENLGITLDIAHANTTDEGPVVYAREIKDYIEHVHISDNTGQNDHMPIGQGNIDFKSVLEELQPYEGFLIIEGWVPENEDTFLKIDKEKLDKIRAEIS